MTVLPPVIRHPNSTVTALDVVMSGLIAASPCVSLHYFNESLNILNVNKTFCFDPQSSHPSNESCSTYWFSTAPDVIPLDPASLEARSDGWVFRPKPDLFRDLPLSKPLLVDCLMPVCAFPISGFFCDLQRYLIYVNLFVAIVATAIPFLRHIAQLYVVGNGAASLIYFYILCSLGDRHVLDLDFIPALVYAATGFVACLVWCLLRTRRFANSFRRMLGLCFFPHLVALLFVLSGLLNTARYDVGRYPSAVLLESSSFFRITSVCYRDGTGSVSLWLESFSYPTRRSDELRFITPPPGSGLSVAPATLSPIPFPKLVVGFGGVLGAIIGTLFLQLLCCPKGRLIAIRLTFLSFLPNCIQALFSAGSAPSGRARDRLLFMTPDSRSAAVDTAIHLVAWVVLVVSMEYGIHTQDSPQSESHYQFSQWGTWVLSVLVAVFTVVQHYTSRWHAGKEGGTSEDHMDQNAQAELQIREASEIAGRVEAGYLAYRRLRHGY